MINRRKRYSNFLRKAWRPHGELIGLKTKENMSFQPAQRLASEFHSTAEESHYAAESSCFSFIFKVIDTF